MRARIINEKETTDFLRERLDIVYTKEYKNFQKSRYGMETANIGLYEDENLVCVLPAHSKDFSVKRGLSIPFKDYIYFPQSRGKIIARPKEIATVIRKDLGETFVEMKFVQSDDGLDIASKTPLVTAILDVKDSDTKETIRVRYDKKTRNEVRKAEKSGLTIEERGSSALEDFYSLYTLNMKRHGTPPRQLSHFRQLLSCFGKLAVIFEARDGTTLAGANLAIIKPPHLRLLFNISNEKYWGSCVNNLLYDSMILAGYERGVRQFDFGPSLRSDVSHLKFKIGFGAQIVPLQEIFSGAIHARVGRWMEAKKYSLKLRIKKLC